MTSILRNGKGCGGRCEMVEIILKAFLSDELEVMTAIPNVNYSFLQNDKPVSTYALHTDGFY
jgi:hypothetical protein